VFDEVTIKGPKGILKYKLNKLVSLNISDKEVMIIANSQSRLAVAQSGTSRALINNMVIGVVKGYERKLRLNGVGYRVEISKNIVNLSLGFSHQILYTLPQGSDGISVNQTEIILRSIDKQLLGQVVAEIRAYRPPEVYKGKGICYDR
jgi:large subunit ribosomal protein L6